MRLLIVFLTIVFGLRFQILWIHSRPPIPKFNSWPGHSAKITLACLRQTDRSKQRFRYWETNINLNHFFYRRTLERTLKVKYFLNITTFINIRLQLAIHTMQLAVSLKITLVKPQVFKSDGADYSRLPNTTVGNPYSFFGAFLSYMALFGTSRLLNFKKSSFLHFYSELLAY